MKTTALLSVELEGYALPAGELLRLFNEVLTLHMGASAVHGAVVSDEVLAHMGSALWVKLGNEDDLGDAALQATLDVFPLTGAKRQGDR